MKIVCSVCKYEFDSEKSQKCPRCGAAIRIKSGCENCSGCSIWKSCKIRQL